MPRNEGNSEASRIEIKARTVTADEIVTEGELDSSTGAPSLLWVAPHGDDHFYIAPLLGELCVDRQWKCTLVVTTPSKTAPCYLPDGCHPDVSTLHLEYTRDSARLFGARLIQWHLIGNGGRWLPYEEDVEFLFDHWAEQDGSFEALIARFEDMLREVDADIIFTFDPRHGAYGHPEHRATAALVIYTMQRMGEDISKIRLAQSFSYEFEGGWGIIPKIPEDEAVLGYDASVYLESIDADAWQYIILHMKLFPAQFPHSDQDYNYMGRSPVLPKRVYFLPLEELVDPDSRYDSLMEPATYQFHLDQPIPGRE